MRVGDVYAGHPWYRRIIDADTGEVLFQRGVWTMLEFYERLPDGCVCKALLSQLPRDYIEQMTVGIEEVRDFDNPASRDPYVCIKDEETGLIMLPANPEHRAIFDDLQRILERENAGDFSDTYGVGFFVRPLAHGPRYHAWKSSSPEEKIARFAAMYGVGGGLNVHVVKNRRGNTGYVHIPGYADPMST
jgi:hypothetical protein